MATLLVNSSIVLEKMTGKGGWTYALIPRMAQISKSPFGWVNVYGRIDGYELKKHKLLSMGNGNLFLPVRSCCIRAFLRWVSAFINWLCFSMALSQVERQSAIFFCSGSGGSGILNLENSVLFKTGTACSPAINFNLPFLSKIE